MTFEQLMLLLTMIAGMLTAIATIGLVIGAYKAWQVAKQNLNHLRADSRSQTRPYVYAKIVPSLTGAPAWDLILHNSGRSSAKNLRVSASAWPEEDDLTIALRRMFETPQILPPNSTIRSFWCLGKRDEPGSTGATGFDMAVDLTVEYDSEDTQAPTYSETFYLDPDLLGMTPVGSSGVNLPSQATPTDKKLREIVRALNELRRGE